MRLFYDPPQTTDRTDRSWWDGYSDALSSLSPAARAVLLTDCAYILDRGVFGAGAPNQTSWPLSRVRTGLVIGSVQSGKTASMLGVTAMSLDRGADVVILLAGTRLSLWRQTYERLSEQLDVGIASAAKSARRIVCPSAGAALDGITTSIRDIYRLPAAPVKQKLAQGRPVIVVAMKQTDHLRALGRALREGLFGAAAMLERPVHMLVIDDESDDGSILDAIVEAGMDPLSPGLKQIPRAIADLWDPRGAKAPSNLFTTYIGYTATPQANLLQQDHNPLAPRDFVVSLRTPLDVGQPVDPTNVDAPRSSTYPEPKGIDYFYTGGEVFYKRGKSADLCVELTGQEDHDLGEAVRAYLVAGAIRLHRDVGSIGPRSLGDLGFATADVAAAASPQPHSMLVHPSADIAGHFGAAEDILLWAGAPDRLSARAALDSGNARLPTSLLAKMSAEEPLWRVWVERYQSSSSALATEFNVMNPRTVPDWSIIKELLTEEVIPGTRVTVVNSDPNADDRPEYRPFYDEDVGRWKAARDLSTIFVSGNVMARGLTLEGMTTALFMRGTNSPFADSQMQMQRWFGYRGKHIELCRLFAARGQIDLFKAYHDIDEALREGITATMADQPPSPAVLHGMRFLATGKIANLGRTPLCPSPQPFVTLINPGVQADPNSQVVADVFTSGPSSDLYVGQTTRGRVLDATLSLTQAADLLDRLRYDTYRPGSSHALGELWGQVQTRVSATAPLPTSTNFYNPPSPVDGEIPSPMRLDPYSIAAYLRLWAACLTRPVRGLFVVGAPSELWSMSDLPSKELHQPKFVVGIRYGHGAPVSSAPLTSLSFDIPSTTKTIGSDGDLANEWGSNNPNAGPHEYRGDAYFDYYHRGESVPPLQSGARWRPAGSSGLILFYVNQLPGQPHPAVAVGVCIPAGGPEQFAATRA